MLVTTEAGVLRGATSAEGISVFRGVPFAAPPVGPLRFSAPAPVVPWNGARDALSNGPTPLRAVSDTDRLERPIVDGDDVLNLNVFTPAAGDPVALLPVFVWIPGGSYHEGSIADPVLDLTAFALEGVVAVTVNHRVGFDGFGELDGAESNRGVRDWIAALGWVQRNIVAFGGDPGAVTVAGQSSGASAVLRLLTMPAAAGLFRGAIAQSPAELDISQTAALEVTHRLAEHFGTTADVEGFEALPVAEVQAAQYSATTEPPTDAADWVRKSGVVSALRYLPVVDGALLETTMLDGARAGVGADVPLLLGAARNELPVSPRFAEDVATRGARAVLTDALGPDAAGEYLARLPADVDELEAVTQFVSDRIFRRVPTRFAAARGGANTWHYEFAEPDPGSASGHVHHSDELKYLWGSFSGWEEPRSRALAARLRSDWIAFVKTGRPGWAEAGAEGFGRRYGTAGGTVAAGPGPLYERERALFL